MEIQTRRVAEIVQHILSPVVVVESPEQNQLSVDLFDRRGSLIVMSIGFDQCRQRLRVDDFDVEFLVDESHDGLLHSQRELDLSGLLDVELVDDVQESELYPSNSLHFEGDSCNKTGCSAGDLYLLGDWIHSAVDCLYLSVFFEVDYPIFPILELKESREVLVVHIESIF